MWYYLEKRKVFYGQHKFFLFHNYFTSLPFRVKGATEAFKKLVISISFVFTKQPMRIAQVLKQVYPVDPSNVDEELVERLVQSVRHSIC